MPAMPDIIARLLAVLALMTLAALALGLGNVGSADDSKRQIGAAQAQADPLWPEHFRCLVLGDHAESDPICRLIVMIAPIDGELITGAPDGGPIVGDAALHPRYSIPSIGDR